MFTGIIESIGSIRALTPKGGDVRVSIDTGKLDLSDVKLGDSIAINGVCLTAVERGAASFAADVSGETLAHTTLGALVPGDPRIKVVHGGGIEWTIKDGIPYHVPQLMAEVKGVVEKARAGRSKTTTSP